MSQRVRSLHPRRVDLIRAVPRSCAFVPCTSCPFATFGYRYIIRESLNVIREAFADPKIHRYVRRR